MKPKYKYKVKIYNAIGNYAGVLKFNNLLDALQAYTSIKRADFFMKEKPINDEMILFALKVLALIEDENPEALKKGNSHAKKVKKTNKK